MTTDNVEQKGGFTPPNKGNSGPAEPPKNTGVVTARTASKVARKAANPPDGQERFDVIATQTGWFNCERIEPDTKFRVTEQEFSERWMRRLK